MVIYDKDGVAIIGLEVDDSSYSYREIMGESKVYLEFSLTEHIELPIGAYIDFQGDRFTLMSPSDVSIIHERNYEYKVFFDGPQARFSKYRVHNPVDGRLVFPMCARPHELLDVIIANLNEREGASVWSAGDYVIDIEKTVSFNHTKLDEALTMIAQAFDTEWEVVGHTISLHKVEYNASAPLALGYGENHGFKSGVGRTNYGENGQVEKVYVQGGDRNISLKEYGSSVLLLPKNFAFQFDGEHFSYEIHSSPSDVDLYEEDGFDSSKAVNMVTDANGFSVALANAPAACNESSLDATDIYPKRVGTVTDVRYVYRNQYLTWAQISALSLTDDQWLEVQVDIVDSNIPASLDYSEYLLDNSEPLTVTFQKGMLAGRTFNATFKKAAQGVTRPANRFELIRANIDGVEMPNATFRPNAGLEPDTYIVTNCYMPDEYICDYPNFSGAEIEMLRGAAKYLYENKDIQLTFKGEIDDLYAKRNWVNVGAKLKLGGCVSFFHPTVQPEALTTRIVAIKQYINNPYSPDITLSNEAVKGGVSTQLATISGEKAEAKATSTSNQRYTKRSFRDAIETAEMLIDAALEGYSEAIQPITVRTMQAIVGDESLQFRYVTSKTTPQQDTDGITYNNVTKKLICQAKIIQHMTLCIDSLTQSHDISEYKFWDIAAYESAYLGEGLASTRFYLYARCLKNGTTATYELTTSSLPLEGTMTVGGEPVQVYNLLVGILNSEYDNDRSFVSLYGFTEILPGQITTDVIRSTDGNSFFDLLNNRMRFGNAQRNISWNLNNSGELRISGGTIIQDSGSQESMITCDRGKYNPSSTYYYGDEVYLDDGSRYVYINSTASSTAPPDTTYWRLKQEGGINGLNTAIVYLYKRAASAPSIDWSNDLTYSFADKALVAAPTGWSETIPAHSDDPLYVTAATASSRGATATIEVEDWAEPVMLNEDGTDGLNTATVYLYKRAASQPTAPSGTLTYTFATGVLSGNLDGWSQTIPEDSTPCWVILATAINTGATDTISTWSSVRKFVENGAKGDKGAKLRGPSEWTQGKAYEDGISTDFQDIVYVTDANGNQHYYVCKLAIANSQTSPASDSDHWQSFNQFDYVATKLIISPDAIIGRLVVDTLQTKKTVSGTEIKPIKIEDESIDIANDSGDTMVKITSGQLPSGSGSSNTYPITSGSASIESVGGVSTQINATINNLASVNVASEYNKVTIPALTLTASASNSGQFQLYWNLYIGNTLIASGSGTGTIPSNIITLPAGNSQSMRLVLSGAVWNTSATTTTLSVLVGVASSSANEIIVAYQSNGTVIAADGAQFNYGYGGFKIGQAGAQIIQGGNAYKALASDAENGLVSPKRIYFHTSTIAPASMENDILYIKVTPQS